MTHPSFPFASTKPSVPAEQARAHSARGPRRLLVSAFLAVATGAAAVLFLGGGDDQAPELVPLSAVVRAPQAAPPAAPVTHPVLPPEHTEDIARNPFRAMYVAPPPPPPAAPPVSAPVTSPEQQLQPVDAAPLDRSGSSGGKAPIVEVAPIGEYPITLVSVSDADGRVNVLTWKVDDTNIDVIPGQRFGRHGELVVLAYTTKEGTDEVTGAVVQVGDAAPVPVSLGETIHVL